LNFWEEIRSAGKTFPSGVAAVADAGQLAVHVETRNEFRKPIPEEKDG
jgi:hypothetical protein